MQCWVKLPIFTQDYFHWANQNNEFSMLFSHTTQQQVLQIWKWHGQFQCLTTTPYSKFIASLPAWVSLRRLNILNHFPTLRTQWLSRFIHCKTFYDQIWLLSYHQWMQIIYAYKQSVTISHLGEERGLNYSETGGLFFMSSQTLMHTCCWAIAYGWLMAMVKAAFGSLDQ